jgi:leader peptidase (prepilin peptidase)/N-methyltransferase
VDLDLIVSVVAGMFGALFGSFLNVCIYRLPRNESVVRPRSRCPKCGSMVKWYDNIPVFSWAVLLRGKCRNCRNPISVQYPLIELAVALAWGGSVWFLGPNLDALSAAIFITLLIGILMTDAQHFIIPDEMSLGGLAIGLVLSFFTEIGIVQALIGAALGFGMLWVVKTAGDYALKRGWIGGEEIKETLGEDEEVTAMGGGDLKMMAMIGSFLGWSGVLMTIFLGALVGTLIYLPFMFRAKKPLVPFGLSLALGAFVTLIAGPRLSAWYTDFLK